MTVRAAAIIAVAGTAVCVLLALLAYARRMPPDPYRGSQLPRLSSQRVERDVATASSDLAPRCVETAVAASGTLIVVRSRDQGSVIRGQRIPCARLRASAPKRAGTPQRRHALATYRRG